MKALRVRHEVQGVIFDETDSTKKILILKKTDYSAKRSNWRLLKGGVKNGETEPQALQREIYEETGLRNINIITKVHAYEFAFKDVKHFVSSYLVKADSQEPVRLQKSEVAGCLWTTQEKAMKMLHWDNEKDALRQLR